MMTILNVYAPLINVLCRNSYRNLKLNFIDPEDLKQEFLEYLLKWTYCEFKRRKLGGSDEIWVPFIKRSFRNFSINFQLSHKRGGKRRPVGDISSLSAMEGSILEDRFGFQVNDLQEKLELKGYVLDFASKIDNSLDKWVFDLLFNPSRKFRKFTRDNFRKLSMFEIIAKYIKSSYSSVLNSYKRLKESFISGLAY